MKKKLEIRETEHVIFVGPKAELDQIKMTPIPNGVRFTSPAVAGFTFTVENLPNRKKPAKR